MWTLVILLTALAFVIWLVVRFPWHILQLAIATGVGGYSSAHQWLGLHDPSHPVPADFMLGLAAAFLVTVAINYVVSAICWLRRSV